MKDFNPNDEAFISAEGLLMVLERETMKYGYLMDREKVVAMKQMLADVFLQIQALPGDVRRGLDIRWHRTKVIKGKEIELGMSYTAVFAVRLVMESLVMMKKLKCDLGIVNRLSAQLRKEQEITDRGMSMRFASTFIKTGHLCNELKLSLETIELGQSHVARTRHISFQYGPYMTKEYLPKKDVMAMSLRLAHALLQIMANLGLTDELITLVNFKNKKHEQETSQIASC